MQVTQLKKLAKEIALLTLDVSFQAKVGHVGSALSIVDMLTVLYFDTMNISARNYKSDSRDIFILSKGHAVASLYATLYKKNILTKKELYSFGKNRGLCEHPVLSDRGIEMTTGSLGHGLAFGVGIAYGQKLKKASNRIFVLLSDGECDEGSVWEAALLASSLNLDNLTVVVDYNQWQCYGRVKDVIDLKPLGDKWTSFGWAVLQVDGHNLSQLKKSFQKLPLSSKSPNVIVANTTSGKNVSLIEDKLIAHYKVFDPEEYLVSRKEIEK